MVVQKPSPWSFKKYAIAGVIGVGAIVGILVAFAYNTPFPKTIQDSTPGASSSPTPQGPTAGAGQDNPGPNDAGGTPTNPGPSAGGGAPDTNPKPIPSPIVAAAIEVTPSTISVGTGKSISMNIGGDGFHPNQTLKVTLDKSTSLQADPSPLASNGNGGFSADRIMIPMDTPKGSHTITATDQSGKSAVANFVVQ